MSETQSIPNRLPEEPSLSYAQLREAGIALLQQLAGHDWTDFNTHDPGVTILEQLCYALTDLGYRIDFPLADLLASGGPGGRETLFDPDAILPNAPVTLDDWRKVVSDTTGVADLPDQANRVIGVRNVWLEAAAADRPREEDADPCGPAARAGLPPAAAPIPPRALYRVYLDLPTDEPRALAAVVGRVWERLHGQRALCEDFVAVRPLPTQAVSVQAKIEIDPLEPVEDLLLTILQRLTNHVDPPIRYYSLAERLAAGETLADIYRGPRLAHGFVDDGELAQNRRRATLRTSDLIQLLMDIPGVRVVRALTLGADAPTAETPLSLELAATQPKARRSRWFLRLDPHAAPRLKLPLLPPDTADPDSAPPANEVDDLMQTHIVLLRRGLPANVKLGPVLERYREWLLTEAEHRRAAAGATAADIPAPPAGRVRGVAAYEAIQHQFPAAYGIGQASVPAGATAERRAQIAQLQAYLLLFDQVLANQFAQLGRFGELFSLSGSMAHSTFSQPVDGLELAFADRFTLGPDELQDMMEEGETAVRARRHRFLNHLLARFGEQLIDYTLTGPLPESPEAITANRHLLADKARFLQDYPWLSAARGSGCNILLGPGWRNRSGLEQRARLKLGFDLQDETALLLVEHILLRPDAEEGGQPTPDWVTGVSDPYSLQLTVMLRDYPEGDGKVTPAHAFVERTIHEETPAHLNVTIGWCPGEEMASLCQAHDAWQAALADARRAAIQDAVAALAEPAAPPPPAEPAPLRQARARFITLLRAAIGVAPGQP